MYVVQNIDPVTGQPVMGSSDLSIGISQTAPQSTAESWVAQNLDFCLMALGALIWAIWKQRGPGIAFIVAGLLVRIRDSGAMQATSGGSGVVVQLNP